jgi:addiction module RelE/StbE family toxin
MIEIDFHKKFQKHYLKRIKFNTNLDNIFHEKVRLFSSDPNCKILNNHYLTGRMKKLYSFSITGDIRVIYQWVDSETVLFLDIGSHNQVY